MNQEASLAEPAFETGLVTQTGIWDSRKQWALRYQLCNLAIILGLVCCDPDNPIFAKSSVQRREEGFRHKPARSVAPFRPWIGKQEIKCGNGVWRHEMIERVGNFESHYARVRQADAFDFSTGSAHPTKQAFDAQKILVGIFLCNRRQKRTVTAAEIDFDRGIATKNGAKVDRGETIRDDEFGLACYGGGGIGGHVR